ncbi:hypothetical protein ACF1AU_05775 [Streptomyces rubrogriseus]|uniref:hypothetical protein n=1 Tax=Streptomyces rubrogriseus TaxID=194673 RepID=UPI0037033500
MVSFINARATSSLEGLRERCLRPVPPKGMAVRKPVSMPRRSAWPAVMALWSSLRDWLKTSWQLRSVTVGDRPSSWTMPRDGRPWRARWRWSADEPLGVLTAQHGGVVAGVGGVGLEGDAQFDGGAAHLVEGASGTGALRGTEPLGEVIPEQVTQPPLGNGGDVEVALGVLEASSEVIGLQEAGVLGV